MGGNLGTRIRSWPGGTHLKSQLLRRQRQEDGEFKASPAKLGRPCLKNKTNERTGVMTQVVEHLSSMLEALSSIPSTADNNNYNYNIVTTNYMAFFGPIIILSALHLLSHLIQLFEEVYYIPLIRGKTKTQKSCVNFSIVTIFHTHLAKPQCY
jgi:hypothetical protein